MFYSLLPGGFYLIHLLMAIHANSVSKQNLKCVDKNLMLKVNTIKLYSLEAPFSEIYYSSMSVNISKKHFSLHQKYI